MTSRKRPDSYISLTSLINTIRQQAQGIPVANLPFSPTAWAAFGGAVTIWLSEHGEKGIADSVQQTATDLAQPAGNIPADVLFSFCSIAQYGY